MQTSKVTLPQVQERVDGRLAWPLYKPNISESKSKGAQSTHSTTNIVHRPVIVRSSDAYVEAVLYHTEGFKTDVQYILWE